MTRRDFGGAIAATAFALTRPWTSLAAASTPAEILLIRHGEEEAKHPDEHLSAPGRRHADRIPGMFPAQFAAPAFLFAAQSSAASHRSVETLTPLAAALHLKINDRYEDNQYRQLAREVLTNPAYANGRVLICWQHQQLPKLAAALGATHAPAVWPGSQFDHVWRLQFTASGIKFTDVKQQLADHG